MHIFINIFYRFIREVFNWFDFYYTKSDTKLREDFQWFLDIMADSWTERIENKIKNGQIVIEPYYLERMESILKNKVLEVKRENMLQHSETPGRF